MIYTFNAYIHTHTRAHTRTLLHLCFFLKAPTINTHTHKHTHTNTHTHQNKQNTRINTQELLLPTLSHAHAHTHARKHTHNNTLYTHTHTRKHTQRHDSAVTQKMFPPPIPPSPTHAAPTHYNPHTPPLPPHALPLPLHDGLVAANLMDDWQCRHNIIAVVNLDPVDGSRFDTDLSVLPLLPSATASFLHIGSEFGNLSTSFASMSSSCAPLHRNYQAFFDVSPPPSWELELLKVGHMQFLDDAPTFCVPCALLRQICVEGSGPDAEVRRISQTAMIAWLFGSWAHSDISFYTGSWAEAMSQQHLALSRLHLS